MVSKHEHPGVLLPHVPHALSADCSRLTSPASRKVHRVHATPHRWTGTCYTTPCLYRGSGEVHVASTRCFYSPRETLHESLNTAALTHHAGVVGCRRCPRAGCATQGWGGCWRVWGAAHCVAQRKATCSITTPTMGPHMRWRWMWSGAWPLHCASPAHCPKKRSVLDVLAR
jgi:hypothetical protein